MTELERKIQELRSQGKSYRQITKLVGCSSSTVCYYLTPGQKEKFTVLRKRFRAKEHPYKNKVYHFLKRKHVIPNKKVGDAKTRELIVAKILDFHRTRSTNMTNKTTFTMEDVIKKFGENPVCYITGEPIDIYKPRTYQFDHIIPASRGGDNSIDNLGICTRKANMLKGDMTPDELISVCKIVIKQLSKN